MDNITISFRKWGSRLHGRETAIVCRNACLAALKEEQVVTLNLAGIKDVTPGFAFECFGMLYRSAQRRNSKIKFSNVKDNLKPIVLSGVAAAIDK